MTNSMDVAPISDRNATLSQKNVTAEKDYWNNFYARFSVSHPSQFCVMTSVEAERDRPIVEFGCGNARDSVYFATHGYNVHACDLSKEAIELNVEKSKDIPTLEFNLVDASNADQVQAVVDKARAQNNADNVNVYTRFFLHSIDATQENKFFAALSNALVEGDKLYFEFRSKMDETLDKVHGKEHYRRYVDTPKMMEDLTKIGFAVVYEMTGQGMAKYKAEDPFVSRIIARKV
eukprot:CAMPEP_0172315780 /NCGR_PEP_ID=MMETSP1058-20130122/26276_1 /TAXON_ID=83371 /ORGANISM="Detonula confervacea, Strain CCMP 353" /LENGTH=232 /DNA_ID=CAMNT_0013029943 /DNA_START=93 /DNA_END=791 /DNA_ORIENTATION=-